MIRSRILLVCDRKFVCFTRPFVETRRGCSKIVNVDGFPDGLFRLGIEELEDKLDGWVPQAKN